MNEAYDIKQNARTIGSVAIAGVLATQLLAPILTNSGMVLDTHLNSRNNYESSDLSPTCEHFLSFFTDNYYRGIRNFETSITEFYATLVSSQEPLGIEFEKVLYDNLWDLYEE